jgi:hypothetical protein
MTFYYVKNKSECAPFYMVEVFTKPGINSEWGKQHITKTTGFVPAIYDRYSLCDKYEADIGYSQTVR